MAKSSFLYIGADGERSLSIGVAKDLEFAIARETTGAGKRVHLVHWEEFGALQDALSREVEVLALDDESRKKLIERRNPDWKDLLRFPALLTPAD